MRKNKLGNGRKRNKMFNLKFGLYFGNRLMQ